MSTAKEILIVEDDPATREGLAFHLTTLGYQVATAADGVSALAALRAHPPDVMLLDLMLPGGMDGIQVLQDARQVSPRVGTIVITGYPSAETTLEALRLGVYDYVTKPFDLHHITRLLDALVARVREEQRTNGATAQQLRCVQRAHEAEQRAHTALRTLAQTVCEGPSIQRLVSVALAQAVAGVAEAEQAWCFLRATPDEGFPSVTADAGVGICYGGSAGTEPAGSGGGPLACGTASCECVRGLVSADLPIGGPRLQACPRLPAAPPGADPATHLCLPLRVGDTLQGVLNVAKASCAPFTPGERSRLQVLADVFAVGLHGIRRTSAAAAEPTGPEERDPETQQAERLRAVGLLASGVAHDLNNLLAVIVGSAELTLRGERDPRRTEELQTILRAAQDGAQTVRRILDYNRASDGTTHSHVDLCEIVRQAVDLTRGRWRDSAQARGVALQVALELAPAAPVFGNPSELREVLTNLILNAVDAMPSGGRIGLQVRLVTKGEGPGAGRPGESGLPMLELLVCDTGVGMAEEVRRRVFDPFFTTKQGSGSGLGLAVVGDIVRRHGGTIRVDSTPGQGSTFVVRLPRSREAAAPTEGCAGFAPAAPAASTRAAHILVLDDEVKLAELLQSFLEILGHRVRATTSPAEALRLLGTETFDLVMTDLGMPELSGWDIARAARQNVPPVPVILVSGWGAQIDPAEVASAGVVRVIHKPYGFSLLRETIREVLDSEPLP
jgi:signal transduction histidine kinase/DNA-binding response OmpR family regulator